MPSNETCIDQITVAENGIVLYRETARVVQDGTEISKTFRRSSLTPGQDLTGQPEDVVAICTREWTPDVLAAWKAKRDSLALTFIQAD